MTDPELNDHAKEIEFQTRKVAALERFIAQIDLDLTVNREVTLRSEATKREFAKRLEEEREYLDWLTNEAGDTPANG
jgi:hypothetical protein